MWFSSWLTNRNSSPAGTRGRPSAAPGQRPTFQPRLEELEARWLPSFAAPVAYHVGYQTAGSPIAAVVADFNGDGRPDLITTDGLSVTVLLGKASGKFGSAVYLPPITGGT